MSIIFLLIVLFKFCPLIVLLFFSHINWAAVFSGIYVLFVHRDVVGSSLAYMFSCFHSIRTYSLHQTSYLGVVKSSEGVELRKFITVMSHHIERRPSGQWRGGAPWGC